MIADETSDEGDEGTPPPGLTPAAESRGAAETDSDVLVGGETSSEGETSGDDASEVGETASGGGVAMTPAIAYEMQTLTFDGGSVETASEANEIEQQPRRGRGRQTGQAARRRMARARGRAPREAAPLPADGNSDDSSGRED